ncbi:MAG: protein kinase [Myxococcales bacterium]|nr:protein kinase [Myxococcales bacterium]
MTITPHTTIALPAGQTPPDANVVHFRLPLDELYAKIMDAAPEMRPQLVRKWAHGDHQLERTLLRMVAPEPIPGMTVAERYRLVQRIGKGSNATVWKARDNELKRGIALKLFSSSSTSIATIERVVHEAQASSGLVSDHTIRIYNSCIDSRLDLVGIDMELCSETNEAGEQLLGEELGKQKAEPLKRRSLAFIRKRVRWAYESSLGVREAHRQNVYHLDIKSANILLRPVSHRAQVVDFGLAWVGIVDPRTFNGSLSQSKRTVAIEQRVGSDTFFIAGTPAYMAPEQAFGLRRLDPEGDRLTLVLIDVYGIGGVLYELLVGLAPHEHLDPNKNGLEETLARARDGHVDLDVLRTIGVPQRLIEIIQQALANKPTERYESMDALAADLLAFLENRPTSHDRLHPTRKFGLLLLRNPQWVSAISAACIVMMSAVFTYFKIEEAIAAEERSAVADKDARISQERTIRADSRAKAAEAQAKVAEAQAKVAEARVAKAEVQVTEAVTRAEDAEKHGETVKIALATVETERDKLGEQKKQNNEYIAELERRIFGLELDLEEAHAKRKTAETNFENEKSAHLAEAHDHAFTQDKLDKKTKAYSKLETDHHTVVEHRDSLAVQISQLEGELQQCRADTIPVTPVEESEALIDDPDA